MRLSSGRMMAEENVIDRGGLTRTTTQSRVFTAGLVRFDRKDPTDRITTTLNDLAGLIHQRIEEVPGGVDITDYDVNALGRIEQITDPSGGVTVQKFNAFGERISLTKPSPGPLDVHSYAFDAYGRLNSWQRHGIEVSWVWDDRSDVVEERYRVSQTPSFVTLNTFGYDLVGRKISAVGKNPILQQELGFSQVEAGVEHAWEWDAAGRVIGQFMGAGTFDASVVTDFAVTAGNLWETTADHLQGASLTGFSHVRSFDGVGRRIVDQTSFGFGPNVMTHQWTGHRQVGRAYLPSQQSASTELGFDLNGFGEMVEAGVYRGNQRIHREQLERDVLGRVRSVRLNSRDEDKDTWYGFEYDARHALGTSWEGSVPKGAGNPGSSGNGNATGNGNAYGIGNGNAPNTTMVRSFLSG